jgi:hypothetical protein
MSDAARVLKTRAHSVRIDSPYFLALLENYKNGNLINASADWTRNERVKWRRTKDTM